MGLNGVNSNYAAYETAAVTSKSATDSKKTKYNNADKKPAYSEEAATYEKSSISGYAANSKADRAAIVAQLKADADNRMKQMQTLVTQMFAKQGFTIGNADEMWKVLASGNFTADAETIAQAKEDISENGYWGVNQTSDRIFSFATALAGDDVEQMKKMQEAVEKGFKEATKAWGKELPEISSKTYDTVMKKFNDYYASKETKTEG